MVTEVTRRSQSMGQVGDQVCEKAANSQDLRVLRNKNRGESNETLVGQQLLAAVSAISFLEALIPESKP